MKFLSKITCLLILALLTNCQVSDKLTPRQKWWKLQDKMTKQFPIKPPNGVWLKDNIFLDETEISNVNYLEFLYCIKDSSTSFQEAMKPDTLAWGRVLYSNDIYIDHYLRYPGFRFHPVVGVSYQKIQSFCKWRTEATNNVIKNSKAYQKLRKKYDIEFIFRLPKLEEWIYALGTDLVGNKYGIDTTNERKLPNKNNIKYHQELFEKEKNIKLPYEQIKADMLRFYQANPYYKRANYRLTNVPYFDKQHIKFDSSLYIPLPVWIYEYYSQGRGFYNLVGNVAEMVTSGDSVFVIGGSFAHTLEELKPPNKGVYVNPEAYIGFRCVAEIKITKKK
jgi:hypothetical protein